MSLNLILMSLAPVANNAEKASIGLVGGLSDILFSIGTLVIFMVMFEGLKSKGNFLKALGSAIAFYFIISNIEAIWTFLKGLFGR